MATGIPMIVITAPMIARENARVERTRDSTLAHARPKQSPTFIGLSRYWCDTAHTMAPPASAESTNEKAKAVITVAVISLPETNASGINGTCGTRAMGRKLLKPPR